MREPTEIKGAQVQNAPSELKLTNLKKTFYPGTPNEKVALAGLSLKLTEGDFVTVIGSNGAGKSTLFNMIAGTILPDSGQVKLGGVDLTYLPEHKRSRHIGRLFQDPLKGTAPGMTIEENLALAYLRSARGGGIFSRLSSKEHAYFRARLAQLGLGLEDRMKSPVGLLSGGQRQALTLLMATLVPPKLLLLDEHTAALDPATAEKVLALTHEIVRDTKTLCMMITHNISSALQLGNRTIMMDSGNVVLDIKGEERDGMTVSGLLAAFKERANKVLDNDRMLLGE